MNREKVIQSAQKHAAKGNFNKAVAEYEKLLALDPSDTRTALRVAELYSRQGNGPRAIEMFRSAAETYRNQGFLQKAVAVYKQALNLDPENIPFTEALGETYLGLRLMQDAAAMYERAASIAQRAGNADAHLNLLKKTTELAPDSVPARIKYAEALSSRGEMGDAADEFEAGAGLLKAQGRMDDYLRVAERLLYHRPDDVPLARELATLYLRRNDPKRALAKLQICFRINPRDIATLDCLSDAFLALGESEKAVSVLEEIANIYSEANKQDEADKIRRRIAALQGVAMPEPEPEPEATLHPFEEPASKVSENVDDLEIDDDMELLDDEMDLLDDDVDIVALEEDPTNISFSDDVDISADADDLDVEFVDSDEFDAQPTGHQPSIANSQVDVGGTLAADSMDDVLIIEDEEPQFAGGSAESHIEVQQLLAECDVFERYGLTDKVINQLNRVLSLDPAHVEARERLKDAYLAAEDEANAVAQLLFLTEHFFARGDETNAKVYLVQAMRIAPSSPDVETWKTRVGGVEEFSDERVSALEDALSSLPNSLAAPDGSSSNVGLAIAGQEQEASDVEDELDEIQFYMVQGLFDEASQALDEALGSHPQHPGLLKLQSELQEKQGAAGAAGDQGAAALAEHLAEEVDSGGLDDGAESIDVETVFSAFKAGVAATVDDSDGETHYELGIAYKEMGLMADAIDEFKVAANSVSVAHSAWLMVGLCELEQGAYDAAVVAFEKALESPGAPADEAISIRYELGNAYELKGDVSSAIGAFEAVAAQDPGFNDVADRLAKLRGGAGSKTAPPPAAEEDDIDKAFDDIFDG